MDMVLFFIYLLGAFAQIYLVQRAICQNDKMSWVKAFAFEVISVVMAFTASVITDTNNIYMGTWLVSAFAAVIYVGIFLVTIIVKIVTVVKKKNKDE